MGTISINSIDLSRMSLLSLFVLVNFFHASNAFSPEFCSSVCSYTRVGCWLCQGMHGGSESNKTTGIPIFSKWKRTFFILMFGTTKSSTYHWSFIFYFKLIQILDDYSQLMKLDDDVIDSLLRAPSKLDLIKRGKISHHRQQKIVGGSPVQYGKEAPWTVR